MTHSTLIDATASKATTPKASWTPRFVGSIKITDLEWNALEYLCFSMRDIDKREIFGNLESDNPLELSVMIHNTLPRGEGWVGWYNGKPVAAMGIFEQWRGNWQGWMLGTDEIAGVIIHFRDRFDEAFARARAKGLRRLEAKSIVHHTDAHRLLKMWGFEREGLLRCYGKDGDDYIQFARLVEGEP